MEYAHGTAPGARIRNYMAASTSLADFSVMYNRIVTDNPGHVVSTSWGACESSIAPASQQMDDAIFANANAIGQSWFAASGDNGSKDCNNVTNVDNPANSPHVIGVGGTTPGCSTGLTSSAPACGGYGSETGWSGSGGGVSAVFMRPAFQSGCGTPPGATRLVPDVALEADTSPGNYVVKNGSWYVVGGTSGAAPQWAGFFAQLNQRAGGGGVGNPGALLYGLCGTAAFHDITTGSNGDYFAGVGYDLVTGLGTVRANNFFMLAVPSTTSTTTSTTSSTTTFTTTSTTSTTTTSATSSTTTSPTTTSTASSTTTSTSSMTTSSTTTTNTTLTTTTSTTTASTPTSTTTSTTTTTSTVASSTSMTVAPTSTTSITATRTTIGSPTTTTSTGPAMSSTTTVPATTTSTTLPPGCPPDGFAGLRCVLAPGLRQAACAADTPPSNLTRRFAHALRLVDRAEASPAGKRQRRLLTRVARTLGRAARSADRAGRAGRLPGGCTTALHAMLADGAVRAARLAL